MALILVVEDDDTIRQLIVRLLSMSGHQVLDAFDGEDGIQKFRQNSVDLVITDWSLPRKDGGEVIQEVRRQEPSAQIILMTAHVSVAGMPAANLGVQEVLRKPFKLADLEKAVEKCLAEGGRQCSGRCGGENPGRR